MHTIKNKYLAAWLGACLFLLSGCDLQQANVNPNSATDVQVNVILPVAQANMVWAISDFSAQTASSLIQQMTGTLNVQYNVTTYAYLPTNFQSTWNNHFYAGALMDLKTIMQKATENGSTHYRGIAKIQTAMLLGYLVDLWGDVPYATALDLTNVAQPTYDQGEALYQEVFRLLDSGIEDLNAASSFSPSTNDLVFPATNETNWRNNSRPRWIKSAYALKARYHNHLSKIDPTGSAQQALAAINAGTFASNAEEMKVSFGTTPDAGGPWFGFLQNTFGQNNISVSTFFIDLLRDRVEPGVNDPRLPFYVRPNAAGNFVGTPAGSPMVSGASQVGPYIFSAEAPTNLVTYAEVKFIEAEAHLRLNQFAQAAAAYNAAVKASLLRVTGSAQPTYEAKYASETAETILQNGFEKLFTEKYIALFLQTEAWADWRRSIPAGAAGTVSGIPNLTPPAANVTNGVFPRRFLYPPSELDNNSANIPETSLTARVFWDR